MYAYLPIRSSAEPYVNWGSPTNWEKMVDHIAREQYKKPGSQVAPRTVEKTLGQLGALWEHFQRQFTLWLVPLVAAGWVLLSRRDRLAGLYLSLIAAACTLGIIAYTNFDLDREGIHAKRVMPPTWRDPALELLLERGRQHEAAYVELLRSEGRSVDALADGDERSTERTVVAMRDGADVIVQATLKGGRWQGRADLLLRVPDSPSDLGDWSYEVCDTQSSLKRHVVALSCSSASTASSSGSSKARLPSTCTW